MRTCGRMVTKRRTLALTQTCPHRPIDCWGSHRSLRSPLYFYAHTVITQRHTMWSHSGTHCHICNFLLFKLTSSSWWSWVIVIVCSCVMFLNSNALVTIKDIAQILPTHMHIMRRIFYVVDINISIMKYFLRQHLLMFEATYHWGYIHSMNFVDFSPVEKMKLFLYVNVTLVWTVSVFMIGMMLVGGRGDGQCPVQLAWPSESDAHCWRRGQQAPS